MSSAQPPQGGCCHSEKTPQSPQKCPEGLDPCQQVTNSNMKCNLARLHYICAVTQLMIPCSYNNTTTLRNARGPSKYHTRVTDSPSLTFQSFQGNLEFLPLYATPPHTTITSYCLTRQQHMQDLDGTGQPIAAHKPRQICLQFRRDNSSLWHGEATTQARSGGCCTNFYQIGWPIPFPRQRPSTF
jgi:hypothetical protein